MDQHTADSATTKQSNLSLQDKMERFESICHKRKQRVTPLRRNVLSTILKTEKSIKAYDIIRKLSTPAKKVKPPVVYRALEFLQEQGFIHRIERDNSYAACAHPEKKKNNYMLVVCKKCGVVEEFGDDSLSRIIQLNVHNAGFEMAAGTLEVGGVCPSCLNSKKF